MPRLALAALCALVLAPTALAQSAEAVLQAALDRYEADLSGVENYTLTRSVMGTESVTYAERTPGGAPLDFTMYIVTPAGLHEIGEDDGAMASPYLFLDRVAESARYDGTANVNGEAAHAVVVENFGEIARDFDAMPDGADAEMEVETLTLYIGTGDSRLRGMSMDGTMTTERGTSPVTMETRFLDYRTVEGFTMPFRTTMEIHGLESQVDPAEREDARRQLEEAKRQMEAMPAAQREMMERMMGPQLEQLEALLQDEAFSFEMQVADVKVNTGRPN